MNVKMTDAENTMINAILWTATMGQKTRLETPSLTALIYTDTIANLIGNNYSVAESSAYVSCVLTNDLYNESANVIY